MFSKKYFIIFLIFLILLVFFLYFFKFSNNFPWKQDLKHRPDYFGITFSKKYCGEIGLDWKETYLAVLDDLKVKEIRLPIYWDEIEMKEGIYDFTDYDYIISEGAKRNVKFIINIGWRLPRWPECHAPSWTNKKSLVVTQARTIKMLTTIVNRYKNNSSIIYWQIENEPFLNTFGICPPSNENFLQSEINAVKKIDNRPVLLSATGELSLWTREAKLGDIFGSTVYRVVWGSFIGYARYPFPAWFYRAKAALTGINVENRVIIELQAEPWVPNGNIIYLSEEEANKSFDIKQFKANLQYGINVNFKKAYLWGVEWWYYQYKNGHQEYWDLARTIF